MGFGGTSGMNASIKANAALRSDRKRVFENKHEYRWNGLGQDEERPICSPATAKRNREKFWAEKRRDEKAALIKTLVVVLVIGISVFLYFSKYYVSPI